MAIGTGQVSVTDIGTELGGAVTGKASSNGDLKFSDWSKKLWKGGPTTYASFREVRSYGSNCTFSTVVAAQGTGLAGMNAAPYSISEWKGYTHLFKNGDASTGVTRSTIGRKPTSAYAQRVSGTTILSHVVAAAQEDDYDSSSSFEFGTVSARVGISVWAEKSGSVVSIKLGNVTGGGYINGGGDTETFVQQLGANDGADQTTSANTTGQSLPSVTLMTLTDATNVTGCSVSLESGLPSFGLDGYATLRDSGTNAIFSGSKVVTVDHAAGTGATSTTNLGSTKIGYDLCVGGAFYFSEENSDSVGGSMGAEFTFTATNSANDTMDQHMVTVYVSAAADAEFSYSGE